MKPPKDQRLNRKSGSINESVPKGTNLHTARDQEKIAKA
jgi:hypothetical protein